MPVVQGEGRKPQREMKAATMALSENTDTPQQPMKDKAYKLLAGSVLQQKTLRSSGVQFYILLYNLQLSYQSQN